MDALCRLPAIPLEAQGRDAAVPGYLLSDPHLGGTHLASADAAQAGDADRMLGTSKVLLAGEVAIDSAAPA